MNCDTQDIIQEVRAEFDKLLDFVTGAEARIATADHIERGLFKRLLHLGAQLLLLFFVMRAQQYSREPAVLESGQELPYHSEKKRTYFSIFGQIPFWRPYFYQTGAEGHSPLDVALSLGSDRYSDLLRDWTEYLGVYVAYNKGTDLLARFFDLVLSTRVVQDLIATDAADVEAFYAQKPTPAPDEEAEILVIQADGKGVPLVLETPAEPPVRLGKGQKRGRKKEAIVTTVYTIAPNPRTPEEVVAGLFHQACAEPGRSDPPPGAPAATTPRPKPQHKHIWATLDGKDAALDRLAQQVTPRQGYHIQHQVALCDGCEALQSRLTAKFADFALILDFIHPDEYLWDVATSLLGETHEQRTAWVVDHILRMLSGETAQIVTEFRELAQEDHCTTAQRQQLTKTANYFERNLPYMDYPTYLAQGWPIASGVIEGACRHLVKDRCELSGMRWTQEGVEHLLRLRAVAENDDWEAYHDFRRRQRHARLYNCPFPGAATPEGQALDPSGVTRNQQRNRAVAQNTAAAATFAADHVPDATSPGNRDRRRGEDQLPLAA